MEPKDIVTMFTALVGMVLGIYNFVRARAADKVDLRVVPKASSFRGNGPGGQELYIHNRDAYDLNHPTAPPDTLSLEVINLSKFAVTVDEVGLMRAWSRRRMALVTPIIMDGGAWPRRLEPRESVMIRFDATNLLGLKNIGRVTRAYASTVCGTTCYGKSGALRQFIRIARGKI
jgi:hypothetical protein